MFLKPKTHKMEQNLGELIKINLKKKKRVPVCTLNVSTNNTMLYKKKRG